MRHRQTVRRGNCLFQIVVALAILGLLAVAFGAVSMYTSGASDAVKSVQTQFETLVETSTPFEAPGKVTVEMQQGASLVGILPSGEVNGKKIGAPASGATFRVTVTDAEGKTVEFKEYRGGADPRSPVQILGFFEMKSAGSYTVEVTTGDGSPAALFVAAGTQEEVDKFVKAGMSILQGIVGGCISICGCAMLAVFGGVAAFLKLRRKQPDPLEHV